MNDLLKNTLNIFEPHLYELDQTKLSNIEIFGKKKFNREYDIIQRKIIFSTNFDIQNNTKNSFINEPKPEIEKKYYSNYKFFRDYLYSNFECNEIKSELNEIKFLLENTKKIREDIDKYLSLNSKDDSDFFVDKSKKDENNLNNENTSLNSNLNKLSNTNINKTIKTKENSNNNFFNLNLMINNNENNNNNNLIDILQNFKLLKIKENHEETKQEDFFRFYSELDNKVDSNAILLNDNIAQNKFFSFHKKLSKFYHTERFFVEFASEYNKPPKGNNSIAPEIRMRMPVDYIDSIFKVKGKDTFANLDAFMVKYDREHKANSREKDLLENIYGILSKCDSSNFLSFLYSKNQDFKYIYDDFAKSNINKTFDALELSGISNDSEIKGESI